MLLENVQRKLLYLAEGIAAVLLIKFAIDFANEMSLLLAAPFWLLALAALGVAIWNLRSQPRSGLRIPLRASARAALLAMIPVGFFVSALDCSGLSLTGCAPFCSFVKTVWIPALALFCVAFYFNRSRLLLLTLSSMIFIPLVPHCICFNVGNGWWIEHLGASPMCYAWGFLVSIISLTAIFFAPKTWPSLLINGAIISGATAFFISHHYFHFPW